VRHGTDFGNGAADRLFFQVDEQLERYRAAKRAAPPSRHAVLLRDTTERALLVEVVAWIRATLAREHPELPLPPADLDPDAAFAALATLVQEDLVVIRRLPDGDSSALAVHVSIPTGWRPERIHGASFGAIHAPVPDFAKHPAAEQSMVAAMVDRGPYVRFVWTVCADDHLDHHPEEGRRAPWRAGGPGFLRVERQITVPFPAHDGSLFLIRVHLYPFASLTRDERAVLATAIERMPPAVAAYKGLAASAPTVLDLLRGPER